MLKKGKRIRFYCFSLVLLLFVSMTAGCAQQGEGKAASSGETELIWYYPTGAASEQTDAIFAAANKIIKEKINATVDFRPYERGEYSQKVMLKMSANEAFDICYTSSWLFPYIDGVKKNAFLELDELLTQYAPKTKEMIPQRIWDAVKIGGKTYSVPNYQMSFVQHALVFNKALVEKYQLQEQIDNIEKLEDLTPIFQIIHDNEPDIVPTMLYPSFGLHSWGSMDDYYEYPITNIPVGVDTDLNVVNLAEGKPFEYELDMYRLAREWNQKGFFHKDVGIANDFTAEQNAGKFFMFYDTFKPGIEAEEELIHGYPVYVKTVGNSVLSQASVTGTLSAISRTSKNPEKAMEFIELVNTDKELYNILVFGLEGQNYEKVGEDKIEIKPESDYSTYAWALGCNFNAFKLSTQDDNVWEETKRLNEEALDAPLLNYNIDQTPMKSQIANITAAYEQNGKALQWGLLENYEEVAREMYGKLSDDIEAIRAEIEKQIK